MLGLRLGLKRPHLHGQRRDPCSVGKGSGDPPSWGAAPLDWAKPSVLSWGDPVPDPLHSKAGIQLREGHEAAGGKWWREGLAGDIEGTRLGPGTMAIRSACQGRYLEIVLGRGWREEGAPEPAGKGSGPQASSSSEAMGEEDGPSPTAPPGPPFPGGPGTLSFCLFLEPLLRHLEVPQSNE